MLSWLDQAAQPAQWPGWAAFVLGVACFMQTDDRRFRWLMAGECLSLTVHFAWLGQPAAAASTAVSLTRALVSLRWRAAWLAWAFIGVNAGFAAAFYQGPLSLMPLVSSICGTWALFRLQGLRMRALMLVGTLVWVLHNALVGSVGGTLLELVIAAVNGRTMWRLWRADAARPETRP